MEPVAYLASSECEINKLTGLSSSHFPASYSSSPSYSAIAACSK
ncbi:MAG TPA: hypothetical protein VIP70_12020 [Nitrososphaeraceae archaeon]